MTTPRQVAKAVVVEREKRVYGECPYCGRPCRGRACSDHRDLVLAEHALYSNDPAPTHLADAGTGSRQKGA